MKGAKRATSVVRAHPRWTALVGVVVVAGVGIGGYAAVDSRGSAVATAATTTTVDTVATGTIRQSVSASGTLAPAKDETLSFSASGVVTSVAVTEGQTVKKGQRLATINSASLAATVAQNKATVASDVATVDKDVTDSVSATQLASDKAALTAARNQLASAKTALAGATMTSPIAGVVASVGLTVGQSVSGSGSTGTGSTTTGTGSTSSSTTSSTSTTTTSGDIEVISTGSWLVNATVDATSVGLIKKGGQAQLAITGASGTQYGTISSIAVLSTSTSGTASYPVVIAVTGAPTGLRDGEAVTATLIYKQLSNVIVIASAAVHRGTAGSYVDKVVNGKAVQTTVKLGITSGDQVQITSGLSAGDKVQVQQTTRTGTGTGTGTTTGTRTGTGGTGGYGGGTGGGTGGFGGAGGGAPGGGQGG